MSQAKLNMILGICDSKFLCFESGLEITENSQFLIKF